jgi:hypothetical protein
MEPRESGRLELPATAAEKQKISTLTSIPALPEAIQTIPEKSCLLSRLPGEEQGRSRVLSTALPGSPQRKDLPLETP